MKSDFSNWKANARGICPRLNCNVDFAYRRVQSIKQGEIPIPCGEFPESEPETAAVCNLIHSLEPSLVIELSYGESPSFYSPVSPSQTLPHLLSNYNFSKAFAPSCSAGESYHRTF
jgi:hypothetical protein